MTMTERFDVCVVGSANVDLVATAERLPQPGETVLGRSFAQHAGGKGLNQALAAARAGARTAFVGAIGDDDAGALLRSVLEADGIDVSRLATAPGAPTGRALIGVGGDGANAIIVVPGANELASGGELPAARVVLVQLEIPMPAVAAALAAARAAGAVTVLNPAPAADMPAEVVRLCDVVIPNEHEALALGGPERLLELGAAAVVVTMGAAGAQLHTADGVTRIAPFAVRAIDTTAAGDVFCGALCARLAARDDMADALRYASAAGALATTVAGAAPSIPRDAAVRALVGATDRRELSGAG